MAIENPDGLYITVVRDEAGIASYDMDVYLYNPGGIDRIYPLQLACQFMSINGEIPVSSLKTRDVSSVAGEKRLFNFSFSGLRGGTTYTVVAVLRDMKTGAILKTAKTTAKTRSLTTQGNMEIKINSVNECIGIGTNIESPQDTTAENTAEPLEITTPAYIDVFAPEDNSVEVTNTNQTEQEAEQTSPVPYEPAIAYYTGVQNTAQPIDEYSTTAQQEMQATQPNFANSGNGGGIGLLALLGLLVLG